MNKKLFLPALLWAVVLLPAFAQVNQSKDEKIDENRKQYEEGFKQLREISQLKDDQQRIERLEKLIKENPEGPHVVAAYVALFWPVYRTNPTRALEVAERFLQRISPGDRRSKITAYRFKYEALRSLKKAAEIAALTRSILEKETDPELLSQMAYHDKENAARLYEKALTEKRKPGVDQYATPTIGDLLSSYARQLNQQGDVAKAIERMQEAIAVEEAAIADLQKGDEPNKAQIKPLQARVGENSLSLAEMYAKAKDGKKAHEALEKAEAAGIVSPERRSWFLKVRADTYELLGDREKAFDTYLRSFASRMDPSIWRKIQTISRETGRRDQDVMAWVLKFSREGAQPFKPFQLKNLQGETKTFDDFKQKVTLVNFFFPT